MHPSCEEWYLLREEVIGEVFLFVSAYKLLYLLFSNRIPKLIQLDHESLLETTKIHST